MLAGMLRALPILTVQLAAGPDHLVVRGNEIEFAATVHARAFDGTWSMPGYHAIVAKGGRSAHAALLEADVSDTEVLDALEELGAKPGNNVPMEAWEKRRDRASRAPDTVMEGPSVEVLLRLPGRDGLVPLADVLRDPGGRGLDLRFGGNRANIPKWRSGCIVCLYSCPGAKVGNARYTVRDYVEGATRFTARDGALPPDGTRIGVVLRLLPASRRSAYCPAVDPPAGSTSGYLAFRDPVTGKLRQPTVEEAAAFAARRARAAPERTPVFEIVIHPNGMRSVDLNGAFDAATVAVRNPDGTVTLGCAPAAAGMRPAAEPDALK
jgi:hypothetical protein